MDPILAALLITGIKEGLPLIISAMHQSGMTEPQINEAWQKAYDRFKMEDPNLLPSA